MSTGKSARKRAERAAQQSRVAEQDLINERDRLKKQAEKDRLKAQRQIIRAARASSGGFFESDDSTLG